MIGRSPRLPQHLSVSSVQLYAKCPLAWKRRYFDKQPEPPSAPMSFGKAFAEALEAHHRGGDADVVFAKAHYATGNAYPGVEHGLELLELYRRQFDLDGVPEQRFLLPLTDRVRVPVPILGYMDLEREDEVVEFKTSKNPWTQDRADREFQSAVYGWAFSERHGRRPKRVRYIVFSTKTVAVQEISTHPNDEVLRAFELAAAVTWNGIVRESFSGCRQCAVCRPQEDQYVWFRPAEVALDPA